MQTEAIQIIQMSRQTKWLRRPTQRTIFLFRRSDHFDSVDSHHVSQGLCIKSFASRKHIRGIDHHRSMQFGLEKTIGMASKATSTPPSLLVQVLANILVDTPNFRTESSTISVPNSSTSSTTNSSKISITNASTSFTLKSSTSSSPSSHAQGRALVSCPKSRIEKTC